MNSIRCESTNQIMTNIKDILQKLCEYFDPKLTFDEIVDKDEQNELDNLGIITNAMNQSELSNVLQELCNEYRICRDSDVIAVHVETWNEFSKFVDPNQFSVYFYALIANSKSTRFPKSKSIALLAARCYCLCQTSPGSKVTKSNLKFTNAVTDTFYPITPCRHLDSSTRSSSKNVSVC